MADMHQFCVHPFARKNDGTVRQTLVFIIVLKKVGTFQIRWALAQKLVVVAPIVINLHSKKHYFAIIVSINEDWGYKHFVETFL